MDELYKVLVLIDEFGRIIDINSSAFVDDEEGWKVIDQGLGNRFLHAQGYYFPRPFMDERGVYRYKLVNGRVEERTQEEMDADYAEPEPQADLAVQVAELRESNRQLQEALELLLSGEVE